MIYLLTMPKKSQMIFLKKENGMKMKQGFILQGETNV